MQKSSSPIKPLLMMCNVHYRIYRSDVVLCPDSAACKSPLPQLMQFCEIHTLKALYIKSVLVQMNLYVFFERADLKKKKINPNSSFHHILPPIPGSSLYLL